MVEAMDPHTPVVVGGGQWSNRVDQGDDPVEPVGLVAEALRRAAADTGVTSPASILAAVDALWIVEMFSWRYRNAAALVAEQIGASPRDTAVSPVGGNEPQTLVNQACKAIATGQLDVVAIGGGEAWRSRGQGADLGWTTDDDPAVANLPVARRTGEEAPLNHPAELALRVALPTQIYPLFEQALRHAAGRAVDDHLVEVSELWARFSDVAATNEHAWVRRAMTPEEIRTPAADNRWVGWPYTKVMNANNAVEQSAGLFVMSASKATELGVPRDRWVFPLASVEAHDHYAVSHRADLASSPAIRLAGQRLFELAGFQVDEVAHVDLYSCFPSAVEVATTELGLTDRREPTVTGGLSFAGGPWNNYVTHSIATMVTVLRNDPGSVGLVTANGGYLTKHALGLYSTEPPADGFRWDSAQDEVDALPHREVLEPDDVTDGVLHPGEIESWTVTHDRDNQPAQAIATVLLGDGRRAWATTAEPDSLTELTSGVEQIGRKVEIAPDSTLQIQ